MGGSKIFFLVAYGFVVKFWPVLTQKFFSSLKNDKVDQMTYLWPNEKVTILGLEKYFLGLNRSEFHHKTIGDQKKKIWTPPWPPIKNWRNFGFLDLSDPKRDPKKKSLKPCQFYT